MGERARYRDEGSRGPVEAGVEVRWGLREDEARVAELLELNGMPRWSAFEERYILAGERGEVLAALGYRTASKRLFLGLLVADPWGGERRLAEALYAGALDLAREAGIGEVYARAVCEIIRVRLGTAGGGVVGMRTRFLPSRSGESFRRAVGARFLT